MKIIKHILPKEFDKLLAYLALGASIVGLSLLATTSSNASNIIIVGFLGASFLVYLVFGSKMHSQGASIINTTKDNERGIIATNVLFIFILFLSILIILYRPNPYSRPISSFILISILAGLITLEILLSGDNRITNGSLLIKIIILGILLRWITLVLFPGPIWFDPWYHENIVLHILTSFHIPEVGTLSYEKFPIYHLLISTIIFFTGLDFKGAFLIFICPIEVILQVLLIYMIGNILNLEKKISLIAALLLVIGDYNIANGIIEFPNGFAVLFILAIIYIILKSQITASMRWIAISIIFMLIIILTHTLAAMATAIIILIFWFGSIFYQGIFKDNGIRLVASFTLVLLFGIAMLSWWMYASGQYIFIIKAITWAFQADNFFTEAPIKAIEYVASIPTTEILLDKIGFSAYFFFSSIGCLFLISQNSDSKINGFVYSMGSTILAIIGFMGTVLNLLFIPTRWIFMSQTMLSIPAAIGVSIIGIGSKKYKKPLIVSLITLMAFFMISDTIANFDTPVLSPSRMVRESLYSSELQSIDTITAYSKSTISSDQLAIAYIVNRKGMNTQLINEALDKIDFIPLLGTTIIIRRSIIEFPFYASGSIWKLNFDLQTAILNENIDCVYDSGSTIAYYGNKDENNK